MQIHFAKISKLQRIFYVAFSLFNHIDPDNKGFVLGRTKLLYINNKAINDNFGFYINNVLLESAVSNNNYAGTSYQVAICIPGFLQIQDYKTCYFTSDLQNGLYNSGALDNGKLIMLTATVLFYN